MGRSLYFVTQAVPLYERATPILRAVPEARAGTADPGLLQGKIEISHVSFRYEPDGPRILEDVTVDIRPGQFVAFVGPSGAGKSTLARLLLGFERPESGAIYYDGQDLAELDITAVRGQLGVVLQKIQLMVGSIYTNIVGATTLTMDDAWEAARMAGFEQDIREMPMGMQTSVMEGGSTLSGGQRQRLLIARALAPKPRIFIMDEATSALDTHTQTIVSESLAALQATRIVIAHRLSTIVKADCIYYIDKGRVVQSGTYAELMRQGGPFAE